VTEISGRSPRIMFISAELSWQRVGDDTQKAHADKDNVNRAIRNAVRLFAGRIGLSETLRSVVPRAKSRQG
jgi:hypothetical protein